jgi:cell division protein FtsX
MIPLALLNNKKNNLWKLQVVKKVTNTEPSTVKSNLKKLQIVKKVTKSNKKWKKLTKKASALH